MAGETTDLSSDEQAIFDAEWDSFVATHLAQRDFVDVYEDNKQQILDSCKIAKYQLEVDFGGINAKTNEFGWQEIHPNILLGTTSRSIKCEGKCFKTIRSKATKKSLLFREEPRRIRQTCPTMEFNGP